MTQMRLLSSPLSPYGRKVRLAAAIKGVEDSIALIAADTNPGDSAEINSANPLGKIPILIAEGMQIFDSHVICEYLDSLAPQPLLFPKAGPERWTPSGLRSGRRTGPRSAPPTDRPSRLPVRARKSRA